MPARSADRGAPGSIRAPAPRRSWHPLPIGPGDGDRTETLVLVALCVLAAALRFPTLNWQSFDFDESFTVGVVLDGSLGHALHTVPITESSPPLYYMLAWWWTRIFGLTEVGIRSLSALLGTALVPAAFYIARRLGSRRAGLLAALLVAVNPLMVWYSQEGRTYALLALLSALSFWAFTRALERPAPHTAGVWALASSASILSHYFAGFLVVVQAAWLMLATRRRPVIVASGAVALVGAALVPLALRQADHRTDWIESLTLFSRIKEVLKKWVTGEIAATPGWQLALLALLVGTAAGLAARSARGRARQGILLALGVGGGALLIPLVLDLLGLHYLISKNVMPALSVLLIATGLILGTSREGMRGLAGAGLLAAWFLVLTLQGVFDPAMQRPDYRAAARALGRPHRDQVVVTQRLGDAPLAVYRSGAAPMPAGWPIRQVVLVLPLPRVDTHQGRPVTPPPPPGLSFQGRRDAGTYTLICYRSSIPRLLPAAPLLALTGDPSRSNVQVWPQATGFSELGLSVCGSGPRARATTLASHG